MAKTRATADSDAANDDGLGELDDESPRQTATRSRWAGGMPDQFEGLVDETPPAKYLAIFIDETEASLDNMTEELLVDAKESDIRGATESLLIIAHRIKGSAASIGLHRPAKLAHVMEDILQDLGAQGLSTSLTDAMLRCVDALRVYIQELREGKTCADDFGHLATELIAAYASETSPDTSGVAVMPIASSVTQPKPQPRESGVVLSDADLTGTQIAEITRRSADHAAALMGVVHFHDGLMLAGMKARLLYEKLAQLGDVLYCDPPAEKLDELDDLKSLAFAVATASDATLIAAKLSIEGVESIGLQPVPKQANNQPNAIDADTAPSPEAPELAAQSKEREPQRPTPETPRQASTQRDASRPAETLRVDIDRLDQLMNLAGQLVINKAQFARISDTLRSSAPAKQTMQAVDDVRIALASLSASNQKIDDPRLAAQELNSVRAQMRRIVADVESIQRELQKVASLRTSIADLGDAVHQLDRVADGIQRSVMDTRMVPIGPLFTRFKRVVRDITRSNHKQVELVIRGEKTELDKRMIDELGDPLIHMVRNSADHGIEPPEIRISAGKPAQGAISLEACHRGNSIVIQVTDDGKGLDAEYIRRKAIEKGILSDADAERLSEAQSLALIWEPGFSTADKVTEISGRGMGMDIVRSKIEQLSGTVEVASRKGRGTTFTIKLPLTLAILPSLLVRIEGDTFALPLDAVVEIVTVATADVRTVHRRATARLRNRIVSVVELRELFRTFSKTANETDSSERQTLVILAAEGHEIGLVVDIPLGEEDIVIKSLAENYRNVPGIAGASILGDGRVTLILDPNALVEMASGSSMTASSLA
jgi:two-component system chemotaxis sensor kinase CheA